LFKRRDGLNYDGPNRIKPNGFKLDNGKRPKKILDDGFGEDWITNEGTTKIPCFATI